MTETFFIKGKKNKVKKISSKSGGASMTDFIFISKRTLRVILTTLFVIALVFVFAKLFAPKPEPAEYCETKGIVVKTQTEVISKKDVIRQLESIGEFATLRYDYSGMAVIESNKKFFDLNIPLTKHSIDVMYSGVIKAGIKMDDVDIEVNNILKTITVILPKAVILDNYIDLDSLTTKEKNNIINPIKSDELTNFLKDAESKELTIALDSGIKNKAAKNASTTIRSLLSAFEAKGYEIKIK